jgi:hypothetical protein
MTNSARAPKAGFPEAVALAQRSCGVPVEPVAFGSVTELARVVAGERVQA